MSELARIRPRSQQHEKNQQNTSEYKSIQFDPKLNEYFAERFEMAYPRLKMPLGLRDVMPGEHDLLPRETSSNTLLSDDNNAGYVSDVTSGFTTPECTPDKKIKDMIAYTPEMARSRSASVAESPDPKLAFADEAIFAVKQQTPPAQTIASPFLPMPSVVKDSPSPSFPPSDNPFLQAPASNAPKFKINFTTNASDFVPVTMPEQPAPAASGGFPTQN